MLESKKDTYTVYTHLKELFFYVNIPYHNILTKLRIVRARKIGDSRLSVSILCFDHGKIQFSFVADETQLQKKSCFITIW